MFFLVFHGEERMDAKAKAHLHETPWVVTGPLIALAFFSAVIGWVTIGPVLFGDFFGDAIAVLQHHDVLSHLGESFHGSAGFVLHAVQGPAVWLAFAGVAVAWYFYLKRPELPGIVRTKLSGLYDLLDRKYYFDDLYVRGFAAGGRRAGQFLWKNGDELLIDGLLVNGTAQAVGRLSGVLRRIQTGYLYHYAFAMIIGLTLVLGWLLMLN
jgi:NADH-quinone oxidoreductase subunit L